MPKSFPSHFIDIGAELPRTVVVDCRSEKEPIETSYDTRWSELANRIVGLIKDVHSTRCPNFTPT
jgi:hypothetical protein